VSDVYFSGTTGLPKAVSVGIDYVKDVLSLTILPAANAYQPYQ
jgi:hypothetical protein